MLVFMCYVFGVDHSLFNLIFGLSGTGTLVASSVRETNLSHFSTSSLNNIFSIYKPQINFDFNLKSQSSGNLWYMSLQISCTLNFEKKISGEKAYLISTYPVIT